MKNQPVMGVLLKLLGHQPAESGLDFERRFSRCDAGAIGDPEDVGVDRDGGLTKCGVEHDIGCFATYPGERFQLFAAPRDLAAVLLDEQSAGLNEMSGF